MVFGFIPKTPPHWYSAIRIWACHGIAAKGATRPPMIRFWIVFCAVRGTPHSYWFYKMKGKYSIKFHRRIRWIPAWVDLTIWPHNAQTDFLKRGKTNKTTFFAYGYYGGQPHQSLVITIMSNSSIRLRSALCFKYGAGGGDIMFFVFVFDFDIIELCRDGGVSSMKWLDFINLL